MLSKVIKGYSISFPIAWITDFKLSQLSQLAWCSWEQFPCNSGFWESMEINGQGKDYHPSWQCIPHSVFKYRLAPLRVLRTSSHHFVVALPSSNSFTILCIASNPTVPLTAVLSSPRRERLWEASLTCKILMTFGMTRWSPESSFKILVP